MTNLEIRLIRNLKKSLIGERMIEKNRQTGVQEGAKKQSKGEALVASAYEKVFPEMRERLRKVGVVFEDPKVLVNEKDLDIRDYVHHEGLRTHFPYGSRGLLPYYYVSGESDGRLFYVGREPGFYDQEKKTIVVDLNRINEELIFYKEGDFAKANGVTKEQEIRFIEMQVRLVLESALPAYIVGQKSPYKEIRKNLKQVMESGLSKSKIREYKNYDYEGKTFDNVSVGISFAAEKVVASLLLKKSLKQLLEDGGPDDYMKSKGEICDAYDRRVAFLPNLILNEAKYHAGEMEGYNRQESLARSSSDYINFSPYPYWLTSEGIGVFFAAMLIKKHEKKAGEIAVSPKSLVDELNRLSKKELDSYNNFDYYTPSKGGEKPIVIATIRRKA